jgi:surfeit locus 1 family protein
MTHFTLAHRVFVIRPWPALACAVVIAHPRCARSGRPRERATSRVWSTPTSSRRQLPSQDVSNWGSDSPPEFSRASLQGEWKAEALIYADNQVRDGQVGYSVYMPLCQTAMRCVLVDRGWVKAGARRADLPDVVSPSGMQRVEGVVLRAQSNSSNLSEQSVEGTCLAERHGRPRLRAPAGSNWRPSSSRSRGAMTGSERDVIKPEFGVEKHIAYAGSGMPLRW